MARIRSVHPGFFTDERCVLVSAFARLLFIGLWGQCDDYGVFEWKPTTLKMRLLPADDANVVALLEELVTADCVKMFAVGGKEYGLVRNFSKYQRPKSPKAYYPLPEEYRRYVDPKAKTSEPLPHEFPTAGEIGPQREEIRGGREEEEEVIPLTPLEELNGSPATPVVPKPSAGPTFLSLIAIWPRQDSLPDHVRREWYAAEEQGATGESIMGAARKYLALPEVQKTEPNYLPKLEKWMEGGGWKNVAAIIDASIAEAREIRDQAWIAKFMAEGKRWPANSFPLSVRQALGPSFNGTQHYGPTELIAEYESRGIPVPVWLDPLRLPDNLRKSA